MDVGIDIDVICWGLIFLVAILACRWVVKRDQGSGDVGNNNREKE